MKKPPLYNRSGRTSPVVGDTSGLTTVNTTPNNSNVEEQTATDIINNTNNNNNTAASTSMNDKQSTMNDLLEKAQQFSMFAVHQVEEVRQELLLTADSRNFSNGNANGNNFGGRNSSDIAKAFDELCTAYDKLSMLKWDAVRKEYEETYRHSMGMLGGRSSSMGSDLKMYGEKSPSKGIGELERRVRMMTMGGGGEGDNGGTTAQSPNWRQQSSHSGSSGAMNPHDWIADAFRNGSSLDITDGTDSFPLGDCFPTLNPGTVPLSALEATWAAAANAAVPSPPPGFGGEVGMDSNGEEGQAGLDNSAHSSSKETTQSTSNSSEISSLHTSSNHSSDASCSADEESETESIVSCDSTETPPPAMGNFDFVYKGGYAMKVSNGKETKGVVPKTATHVLVDSSVTTIEEGAFQGCNSLESITIASSVVAVGDNAFRKCSKLKSVVFLTSSSKRCNHQAKQLKKENEMDEEIRRQYSRRSPSATSSSSAPRTSQLRSIGDWAFFNCSSLTTSNLPFGIESIGTRAFQRCSVLSLNELPASLKNVGENAFYGCPRETKAAYERWAREESS